MGRWLDPSAFADQIRRESLTSYSAANLGANLAVPVIVVLIGAIAVLLDAAVVAVGISVFQRVAVGVAPRAVIARVGGGVAPLVHVMSRNR